MVVVEVVKVEEFAAITGLGRTFLYRAMHPDPAYRRGLPLLPSIRAGGRCRRIRLESGRAWLAEMERLSGQALPLPEWTGSGPAPAFRVTLSPARLANMKAREAEADDDVA
jgi:hypothetical protein